MCGSVAPDSSGRLTPRSFREGAVLGSLVLGIVACTSFMGPTPPAQTPAEAQSGFTYVPIDPFAVQSVKQESCESGAEYRELLSSLPDNAVRMLIEQFDAAGSVSFGTATLGQKGASYKITVDYVNVDTINVPFRIWKLARDKDGNEKPIEVFVDLEDGWSLVGYVVERAPEKQSEDDQTVTVHVPVYVGIGLRVAATVDVTGNEANISGVGVIGAEAEAERLKGTLTVQTLGINGEAITAALPIQSELNRTTAQNAIVAVASIKALLYADETIVAPRVVGIYLPLPANKNLINLLISELSRSPVIWERPCD